MPAAAESRGETRVKTLSSARRRILIWPSGGAGAPRPRLRPPDDQNATRAPPEASVVVGWSDEAGDGTAASLSSRPALLAAAVVAGPVPPPRKGYGGDCAGRCWAETVRSAIDLLARRHPCRRPGEDSRDCGICRACATYRSLRVMDVCDLTEPGGDGEDDGDLRRDRRQVILYDPAEAGRWHREHSFVWQLQRDSGKKDARARGRECYRRGTWRRSALRMGEASAVLEELAFALNNMRQHRRSDEGEESTDDPTPAGEGEGGSDDHAAVQSDENSVEKKRQWHIFHPLSGRSLLLLHLTSGERLNTGALMPFLSALWPLFSTNASREATGARHPHRRNGRPSRMTLLTSRSVALLLDSLLGLAIGCALLRHPLPILRRLVQLWRGFHDSRFNDGLEWLESFPAGFKLNVALTRKFGREARWVVLCHKRIAGLLLRDAANLLRCFGLSAMFLGSRFFFAAAFDVARLAVLHVRLLSCALAACQRLELRTLTSLWLLFRGKKRNDLRRRSDHLEYDHMQLLVGIIMFAFCLFTFTTILVYHCFFAVLDFLAELCVCGICWCGFMLVEGLMACDAIVEEERRRDDEEGSWMGREVQFHPATLTGEVYFGGLEGNVGRARECAKDLFPRLSIHSTTTSVMKVVFPAKSDRSIIFNAFGSFLASRVSRFITFFLKFLFGSPCPVASSFVEICRTARNRTTSTLAK